MKKSNFTKILIIFTLITITLLAVYQKYGNSILPSDDKFVLGLDLKNPDKNKWYAGQWDSNQEAWDDIFFTDEGIGLKATKVDKIPYLLSKPIKIDAGSETIIKIRRKVKMKPGHDYFAAGLVLFQCHSEDEEISQIKGLNFGEALFQIEYAANTPKNSNRPGSPDVFRILVPEWQANELYRLVEPIFNEFFDEEIIYNTKLGKLIYRAKGSGEMREVVTDVYKINDKYVRIWMHGYGAFTGHETTIGDFKMTVERAK